MAYLFQITDKGARFVQSDGRATNGASIVGEGSGLQWLAHLARFFTHPAEATR